MKTVQSNTFIDRVKINLRHGFRAEKPLMLIRAACTFFSAIVLRRRPLRYIDIAMDYTCNLKCKHCFNKDMMSNRKNKARPILTVDEYKRIASECMKEGAFIFGFQGGEMFMRRDWRDVIKAFKPKQNIITVTTNGTLLDFDKVKELKDIGVDALMISLDSGIEEEHDRFRGLPGTYKRAREVIDDALKVGLRVSINTTVYSGNIRSKGMKTLIDLAKSKEVILNIIFASPTGEWSGKYEMMITDEDIDILSQWFRESPFIRRDVDSNFSKWGCSAGNEVLYLTPYGDVLPCPFMHFSLGDVRKVSLRTIREKALSYKIFTSYPPVCLACESQDFIEKYISKTFGRDDLPIPVEEVFEG